jgi:hypothetical protein
MGEHCTIETSVLIAMLEPHSYNTTQRLQPTTFEPYMAFAVSEVIQTIIQEHKPIQIS